MKRLLLIRHAKSSWDDPTLRDFDRPLNHRGQRDAPRMAKRLKEKDIHPDLLIASPAVRTRATAEAVATVLRVEASRIAREPRLYHADEHQLLAVVRALPDSRDRDQVVLLFGHNPGLTDFANRLFSIDLVNIPTAGIVAGEIRVPTWADTDWGDGRFEWFDFPKSRNE
ncbi:MAG: histidine phosphatase family protein [Cyclobacteriaceae bacterium]|jgi:phosphohistidine phosphatase|nr:histidine phosphatase family protein [Cyclobacteriaceae bacterium]